MRILLSRDLEEGRDQAVQIPGIRVFLKGRWEGKCKGPELGECLACCRIRKDPSVGEAERYRDNGPRK